MNDLIPISELVKKHSLPWTNREIGYLYLCRMIRGKKFSRHTEVSESDVLRLAGFYHEKEAGEIKFPQLKDLAK